MENKFEITVFIIGGATPKITYMSHIIPNVGDEMWLSEKSGITKVFRRRFAIDRPSVVQIWVDVL